MATRTLPGLGLTGFWPLGDNTWKAANDANIRTLSALVNRSALSRTTALPGSGSIGDIYIVPSAAGSHANEIAIWDGEVGSEAWVYLVPNPGWHLYVEDDTENVQWDGTSWSVFAGAGGGSNAYDLRLGFSATPASNQVLDTILIGRDLTLPANLAGSLGSIGTNPTASFVISVQDDAVEIATITIGTDGSFTFATTGGTAKLVATGSVLTFVAPATVDATAANAVMTILGSA